MAPQVLTPSSPLFGFRCACALFTGSQSLPEGKERMAWRMMPRIGTAFVYAAVGGIKVTEECDFLLPGVFEVDREQVRGVEEKLRRSGPEVQWAQFELPPGMMAPVGAWQAATAGCLLGGIFLPLGTTLGGVMSGASCGGTYMAFASKQKRPLPPHHRDVAVPLALNTGLAVATLCISSAPMYPVVTFLGGLAGAYGISEGYKQVDGARFERARAV